MKGHKDEEGMGACFLWERLRELGLLSQEKRHLRRISSRYINT